MADALSRIEIGLIHDINGTPSEILKKMIKKDPKRFKTIDGRVYLVEKERKRLCIDTDEEKKHIFKEIHDDGGHLGLYKSAEAIRERFYWPYWKRDLKQHLKRCFACETKKSDREPHKEELFPKESEKVFERVHVDICGPVTESDGCKHIIVLQDAFSKWLEAAPIKDTNTSTIVGWLKKNVFHRFGEPDMITTDGGSQFESREFAKFCKNLAIEHHICLHYHHNGNGLVEKAIQTLESMLRTSIENQSDWAEKIPDCIRAYNARKHHTTGVTPYSLMFNREARLKVDREFGLEQPEMDAEMNETLARTNRETETKHMKKMYDRKRKDATLSPGDNVLWHKPDQKVGNSKKLNRKWTGPFKVIQVERPNVWLADCYGKERRIHLNHVKLTEHEEILGEFRGRGRPRKQRGRSNGGPRVTVSRTFWNSNTNQQSARQRHIRT
jgi:hypothetical protein